MIRHERTKYVCDNVKRYKRLAKYMDALPLYRQVDILNRSGIDISRGTLTNWCIQLDSKSQVIINAMEMRCYEKRSLPLN